MDLAAHGAAVVKCGACPPFCLARTASPSFLSAAFLPPRTPRIQDTQLALRATFDDVTYVIEAREHLEVLKLPSVQALRTR